MIVKELVNQGDKLTMMVTSGFSIQGQNIYHDYNRTSESSGIFVMSGVVNVQVKNDVFNKGLQGTRITSNGNGLRQIISLELNKRYQTDSLTYKITCLSLVLKVTKVIIVNECSKFCIELKASDNVHIAEFELALHLDIFSDKNIFTALYDDTEFADFEIQGESGSVKMHKSVLVSHSPVFRSMLSGPWKEAKVGVLEVSKFTKDNLQHLKDYMYLKKMPESGIEQFAALASYYMIPDLKLRCAVKLLGILAAENAAELLELAVKYNIKLLMLGILDSIKRGALKIEDIDRCCTDDE